MYTHGIVGIQPYLYIALFDYCSIPYYGMNCSLSKDKLQYIIIVRHEDQSVWKVSRTLSVSSSASTKTIKCYDETAFHVDRPMKGKPRITSAEEDKFISITSLTNCQLTTLQI